MFWDLLKKYKKTAATALATGALAVGLAIKPELALHLADLFDFFSATAQEIAARGVEVTTSAPAQ